VVGCHRAGRSGRHRRQDRLAAARVQFDGSVVPLVVSGNGGKVLGWDVATQDGHRTLIWIENAATPSLWLDRLCD
jgi:hypothetical protein